jgi:hypothetical protein
MEAVMNLEHMIAKQRVTEAKRELSEWEIEANAILAAMAERRSVPLNPQTYNDLGEGI